MNLKSVKSSLQLKGGESRSHEVQDFFKATRSVAGPGEQLGFWAFTSAPASVLSCLFCPHLTIQEVQRGLYDEVLGHGVLLGQSLESVPLVLGARSPCLAWPPQWGWGEGSSGLRTCQLARSKKADTHAEPRVVRRAQLSTPLLCAVRFRHWDHTATRTNPHPVKKKGRNSVLKCDALITLPKRWESWLYFWQGVSFSCSIFVLFLGEGFSGIDAKHLEI